MRALPGLPGATLDIRWRNLDGYLDSLGAATRKDLRRKRRAGENLRIEWRTNLDGIVDDVQRLYRETHARAQFSFEELTPAYFINVLREMPGRAYCVTYSEGERLLAFNLVLRDAECLLDKFLGMDHAAMDRYNLYHVSWLENVRYCIDEGIGVYESGQGLHREKARLGSALQANVLWYRHRNRFVDGVFARFDELARIDRLDRQHATRSSGNAQHARAHLATLAPTDAAGHCVGIAARHRNAGPGGDENGWCQGRCVRVECAIRPRRVVYAMAVAGARLLPRPIRGVDEHPGKVHAVRCLSNQRNRVCRDHGRVMGRVR